MAIATYNTAKYPEPLVILPTLGYTYLHHEGGCYFLTMYSDQIQDSLATILPGGGEFSFHKYIYQTTLAVVDCNGFGAMFSDCTLSSDRVFKALVQIQRCFRTILWKAKKPSLKHVKLFQQTVMADALPCDIMSQIIVECFQNQSSVKK